MPIASIIIPTCNRDAALARAVNSALSQSISDTEVIVVDDASQDQTAEVLNELLRMDDRLRVLQLPIPLGLSGGLQRNEAVKMARGEYIAYLDDDDVLTYRSIEARIEFLRHRPQLDFCWGRTLFIRHTVGHPDLDGRVVARLVKEPRPGPGEPNGLHWVRGTVIPDEFMHRAGVVGEKSGVWWPSGRGEDRKLLQAIIKAGFNGAACDEVVAIYGRTVGYTDSAHRQTKARQARKVKGATQVRPPGLRRPVSASARLQQAGKEREDHVRRGDH